MTINSHQLPTPAFDITQLSFAESQHQKVTAMEDFLEGNFKHSDPPGSRDYHTTKFKTTIPYRVGRYDSELRKTSEKFLEEVSQALNDEQKELMSSSGNNTDYGNMITFGYPECLPERLEICARFNDFAWYFNSMSS
jgi:hypothetical protein